MDKSALASHSDPLLGSHISEYVIQERIGAGGMGIVYRAVQPLIGKQVAIKVLKAGLGDARELVPRLLVEARVVNAIQHRGVIDIFGFGELPDGRPYVVMELLQGVSLSAFIRKRKRLSPEETVVILDEMLAALSAAHRGDVIHRDLKPGNVFLVDNPEGTRSVKLLDFGIAKVKEFQPPRPLTQVGCILGTPEYMSPEQIRGETVGPGTDLYAVGVIAFQMLSGRLPFVGTQQEVLLAQVSENPPALSKFAPHVPKALENIVMRLLAKLPARRYASAAAVRRDLSALIPQSASSVTTASGVSRRTAKASAQPSPVSEALRTQEVPMLASSTEQIEPLTMEPTTAVTLVPRRARTRWLVGVGAAALTAAAGVMGFQVLRSPAPIPEQAGELQQVASLSTPAPEAPASPAPQASAPPVAKASVPSVQPAPRAELAPTAQVESPSPKRSTEAAPPPPSPPAVRKVAAQRPSIDQPTLLSKLLDAEGRLLKINPTACPVTSPAMARLRELQQQAREAETKQERVKVAGLLAAWEEQFMLKP
ncbi:MAG TPA: serine/threonine-protein kinase [Hyalangium sp.]|nr:serine/threonine-protein kinase [Hyalangium sp.]